jgi:hypothetical protein
LRNEDAERKKLKRRQEKSEELTAMVASFVSSQSNSYNQRQQNSGGWGHQQQNSGGWGPQQQQQGNWNQQPQQGNWNQPQQGNEMQSQLKQLQAGQPPPVSQSIPLQLQQQQQPQQQLLLSNGQKQDGGQRPGANGLPF